MIILDFLHQEIGPILIQVKSRQSENHKDIRKTHQSKQPDTL